jgi:site-specific DNA-methyltransferase (adenine-specific)
VPKSAAKRARRPAPATPRRALTPKPVDDGRRADRVIPLWNQIYEGDTLELMSGWDDDVFHACITDPPYNIARKRKGLSWAFSSHVTMAEAWDRFSDDDYEKFTAAWLSEVCRLVKPNGNIFIFGSYHNIYTIGAVAQRLGLRILNSIIWAKPNAQPNITCRMFTESTEQVLWLCNNHVDKAKNWTFNYQAMKELNHGKQMRNFWEIPVTPKREKEHGKHPSQKPMKVMERLVLAGTNEGDRVLDCFSGSGSTLIACEIFKRRWVAIERSEEYNEIARGRLAAFHRQRRLD